MVPAPLDQGQPRRRDQDGRRGQDDEGDDEAGHEPCGVEHVGGPGHAPRRHAGGLRSRVKRVASLKMNSLADDYVEIKDLKVVSELIDGDFKELQKIATDFTDNGKADVVIMGNNDGKIVGAASKKAIDNEVKINEIIKIAAGVLGGGGGGRLTLAQGAGKDTSKMQEAIKTAVDLI